MIPLFSTGFFFFIETSQEVPILREPRRKTEYINSQSVNLLIYHRQHIEREHIACCNKNATDPKVKSFVHDLLLALGL